MIVALNLYLLMLHHIFLQVFTVLLFYCEKGVLLSAHAHKPSTYITMYIVNWDISFQSVMFDITSTLTLGVPMENTTTRTVP